MERGDTVAASRRTDLAAVAAAGATGIERGTSWKVPSAAAAGRATRCHCGGRHASVLVLALFGARAVDAKTNGATLRLVRST